MLPSPQPPLPPVPEDTARVARAAFRHGNPCLLPRDRLGVVFGDVDFADLHSRRGQSAYAPWRLALVTPLQFREGLSDRQAAEAVRARIDWKCPLALDLTDTGFDHGVLCEFRARLLEHEATDRLLARVLDAARGDGLLRARGRRRTDSTHVLAAVRHLNRIELLAETLRATLNAIATTGPDRPGALVPTDRHERYDGFSYSKVCNATRLCQKTAEIRRFYQLSSPRFTPRFGSRILGWRSGGTLACPDRR